mgnify:FL=1
MKQKILVLVFIISGLTFAGIKPTKIIGAGEAAGYKAPYHQNFNLTLNKDTIYIMTGLYYVDSTFTLTVQAGTVIFGDSATAATLIVKRGAKIVAKGTKSLPIVFTSRKPAGQRRRGDWGGLMILGNAPINKPEPKIEGGIVEGSYGGNKADDSSGVLEFVRIEFPGIIYQTNNETNGLTMGGVGSKTKIENIQVSYSNDDSYEWFGGTVNLKNIIAFGGTDDDFDSDFGYRGNVQFAFGLRDSSLWDAAGQSNGFESDNDDLSSYATPRTGPVFSNVTLVGPQSDTTKILPIGNKFERAALIRRNTQLSIHNSVFVGYPFGMEIRNDGTATSAIGDTLQIRNISLQSRTNVFTKQSSSVLVTFDPLAWFTTTAWKNISSTPRQASAVGLVDAFNLLSPDARPSVNSEATTAGTDFTSNQLVGGFFTSTNYRGAFDPSKTKQEQWDANWTNFNPQATNYLDGSLSVGDEIVPNEFNLSQNYPNPFNPTTVINFSLPKESKIKIVLFDVMGRKISVLADGSFIAGNHSLKIDGSNLTAGTYFYQLVTGSQTLTKKMLLVK